MEGMGGGENPTNVDGELRRVCSSKSCLKKLVDDAENVSTPTIMKKNVSFHQIEIAQYPMELGDNPSATGAPITIGWEPQDTSVFGFEEYEGVKPPPRDRASMLMPSEARNNLLLAQGVTMKELQRVAKENKKIQMQRSNSIGSIKWDTYNYAIEKTRRKIKKAKSLVLISRSASSPINGKLSRSNSEDDVSGPIVF